MQNPTTCSNTVIRESMKNTDRNFYSIIKCIMSLNISAIKNAKKWTTNELIIWKNLVLRIFGMRRLNQWKSKSIS